MKYYRIFLLLYLIAGFLRVDVQAMPVSINDENFKYPLGMHLAFLEDKDGRLSLEDVRSSRLNRRWKQSNSDVPNFGFTESAYWIKAVIRFNREDDSDWLLELEYPHLGNIELYLFNGNDLVSVHLLRSYGLRRNPYLHVNINILYRIF